MAKKKKGERELTDDLLNAFQGKNNDSLNDSSVGMMANMAMDSLSGDEKGEFVLMYTLASNGVTPDEYAQFYHVFEATGMLADGLASDIDDEDYSFPFPGAGFGRSRCEVREYEPLKDAAGRTLMLKIQMKDVSKPPMWREVEIPADFNFLQLHEVIQEVTGLEDCHLWQFNVKAYDDSLQIGVEMNPEKPFNPGLEYITNDAEETPLTQFLQKKGDKLEYVYDFGDDWIFVVEVKDLISKKTEHPVCRKYKSELNAIEDFGGTWAYTEARQDLEEWGKFSRKEKKQRMAEHGFDSEEEYLEFINEHRISLEDVNDALMFI